MSRPAVGAGLRRIVVLVLALPAAVLLVYWAFVGGADWLALLGLALAWLAWATAIEPAGSGAGSGG